jgi:hypothetical protein
MSTNNSYMDPKNPDKYREQVRNITAQAQMTLMGYPPSTPDQGFRTDADAVQEEQYKAYIKASTGKDYEGSLTADEIAKKIQEAFLQDETARRRLMELTRKEGNPENRLGDKDTFMLQAGLRAYGHDIIPLNGNDNDSLTRSTAANIMNQSHPAVQGVDAGEMRSFKADLSRITGRDFANNGEMMMGLNRFMVSLKVADPEGYQKLSALTGGHDLDIHALDNPETFRTLKEVMDKVSHNRDARSAAEPIASWPPKLRDGANDGQSQTSYLSTQANAKFTQQGGVGYDYASAQGPTMNLNRLAGLAQPLLESMPEPMRQMMNRNNNFGLG